jgi:hypothetical protein
VKEFVIYTALRIGLFVVCYAVLAGIWIAVTDHEGLGLLVPFVAAALLSALLSLKLLKGPRERFARSVDARARRAAGRFEEMRSKEDVD